MIYCPLDTRWRKEQDERFARLLGRVERGRKASRLAMAVRLLVMTLVLSAYAAVLVIALVEY